MFPFDRMHDIVEWFRLQTFGLQRLIIGKKCVLSEKDFSDYTQLTFLAVEEVRRAYDVFTDLGADFTEEDKNPYVGIVRVMFTPELHMNPFRDRILRIFCRFENHMCFDEFLNMLSIFNYKTPSAIKVQYAFKIYDFNEDNLLCSEDLTEMVTRLLGDNPLKQWKCEHLVEIMLSEADLDKDGYINDAEFGHQIEKTPEFAHSFIIRL